jgi:hypothetical protein
MLACFGGEVLGVQAGCVQHSQQGKSLATEGVLDHRQLSQLRGP